MIKAIINSVKSIFKRNAEPEWSLEPGYRSALKSAQKGYQVSDEAWNKFITKPKIRIPK